MLTRSLAAQSQQIIGCIEQLPCPSRAQLLARSVAPQDASCDHPVLNRTRDIMVSIAHHHSFVRAQLSCIYDVRNQLAFDGQSTIQLTAIDAVEVPMLDACDDTLARVSERTVEIAKDVNGRLLVV